MGLGSFLRDAFNKARGVVSTVVNKVKQLGGSAKSAVGSILQKTAEVAKVVAKKVGEGAVVVGEKAKDAAVAIGKEIKAEYEHARNIFSNLTSPVGLIAIAIGGIVLLEVLK
jgi:hypothetical protein